MRRVLLLAALAAMGTVASADPIVTVYASFAPNAFGSPSWGSYIGNATEAIKTNQNSFGGFGPAQYNNVAGQTFSVSTNIVTNFDSWMGIAGAAAPFNNEFGTRLHFGVRIEKGSASQFSLSQLSYDYDGGAYSTLDFAGNFTASDTYAAHRYGILYGGDGALGGGDDTLITTGAATQLVDALVYVGVGNATEALTSDPGATNQEKIDLVALGIPGHTVTMTYSLRDQAGATFASGSNFVNFQPVPEPATMAALGLGAVALLRRRRKAN